LARDKGEESGDKDEVPDKHDSVCDKCKEGGGAFCSARIAFAFMLFLTLSPFLIRSDMLR
jgi:hypothetical protein